MRILNIAVILASFFATSSVFGVNLSVIENIYVGADMQSRGMKFEDKFGSNILHKHMPQGNIYGGLKFGENFGIEFGYESTMTRTCYSTVGGGECVSGVAVPSIIAPVTLKSQLKVKGPHLDFIGFYPIDCAPVNIIGSIGLSSLHGSVERTTIHVSNLPPVSPKTVDIVSKRIPCLRLMTGLQYVSESGLGVRGSISFVRSRKMLMKNDSELRVPIIKTRDSFVYGLGVTYMF